jgi:hypothetical protein
MLDVCRRQPFSACWNGNSAHYYQDSLGWLSLGIIDAIAPMLYEWPGFEDLAVWRDVMAPTHCFYPAADRASRASIGGFLAFAGDLVLRYTLHRTAR